MADTVRAAVQLGPRQIEIQEFSRPQIGPDDGLLRVEANGICGSDVETYKGHLGKADGPFIPGHEPLPASSRTVFFPQATALRSRS